MSENFDLETVASWAQALEKEDQLKLLKNLAGKDLVNLETILALVKNLSKDEQASLIKSIIGSEGFTFVSGAHMVTVDLAVYIQSVDKEIISIIGEAISERIRSGK